MPQSPDQPRIRDVTALTPPDCLLAAIPADEESAVVVALGRQAVHRILHGFDDRLLVVIGPCSIHDPVAALDYAGRLARQRDAFGDELEIVMRVYLEKPRTTVGWKGLIADPHLDGSGWIDDGLRLARRLLRDIAVLGVPAGCEFLDTITPAYIADLVSWGAIGARTTESQVHRQIASGLPCPVGFKNGTGGDVRIAVDAIVAASQPQRFLGLTRDGHVGITATTGNEDCHVILRGGRTPNYDAASVAGAVAEAERAGLPPRVVVDASHANSGKNPDNQPAVIEAVARQLAAGDRTLMGVMVESNIVGGRQDLVAGQSLTYGQSITDGCLDWPRSVAMLQMLAEAVRARRQAYPVGVAA